MKQKIIEVIAQILVNHPRLRTILEQEQIGTSIQITLSPLELYELEAITGYLLESPLPYALTSPQTNEIVILY